MCIPASLSLDLESLHGLPSTDEILVGSSDDVVDAWLPVRGWWALEENERGAV